jgi:undecaprenyl-diphosphatase
MAGGLNDFFYDLLRYDFSLFKMINNAALPKVIDLLLTFWRNSLVWTPIYLFLISFVLFNFKDKAWWFILFSLITVLSSDLVSSRIIKPTVQRLRPCNTEQIDVIKRVKCGQGYSFTSSHATNHFALALFWYISLKFLLGKWRYTLLFWAALVGLCQVYVGVHFPSDAIIGSILGASIGVFWATIYSNRDNKIKSDVTA